TSLVYARSPSATISTWGPAAPSVTCKRSRLLDAPAEAEADWLPAWPAGAGSAACTTLPRRRSTVNPAMMSLPCLLIRLLLLQRDEPLHHVAKRFDETRVVHLLAERRGTRPRIDSHERPVVDLVAGLQEVTSVVGADDEGHVGASGVLHDAHQV